MTRIHKIPRKGTQLLLMVLLIGTVLSGCVKVICPDCARACGGKDELPCLTFDVAANTDGSCPSGGKKCAKVGASCTKMSGASGTCQNAASGGVCFCQCQ